MESQGRHCLDRATDQYGSFGNSEIRIKGQEIIDECRKDALLPEVEKELQFDPDLTGHNETDGAIDRNELGKILIGIRRPKDNSIPKNIEQMLTLLMCV